MSEVKELLINSKIGFLKEWEQHESCYIVLAAEYDQAIAALEPCPDCGGSGTIDSTCYGGSTKHVIPCHAKVAQLEKEKAEQAKEIKGLKENLIEYGRHAAGCSQEYAKKYRCRCGWDAVGKVLKCEKP